LVIQESGGNRWWWFGHGSWFGRWFVGVCRFGFLAGLFVAIVGGHGIDLVKVG